MAPTMSIPDQAAIKRRVFNAFDPQEALRPDDRRYVDFSSARSSERILRIMADMILLEDKMACQLLCGHRGCGKTTELWRLQKELEGNGFFVVFCEADNYIELTDANSLDVLLAVVQQLGRETRRAHIRLTLGKFQQFWQGLWDSVTSLRLKEAKVGIPEILELAFEIKNNPTARNEVRQYLQPRTTTLLEAMNTVLERAVEQIKKQGSAGLVIIVDNLDRVLRTPVPGLNRNYQEELFITCAAHLTSPKCHMIYTVPTALIHSPNGAHLLNLYGTQYRMLPMVPISTRKGEPYIPGLEKLKEAISTRLVYANAAEADVFDSQATIERLCTASGGYVRILMALTRNALLQGGDLPIKREAVEFAILQARQGFEVGMGEEHWEMLRTVARSQTPVPEESCLQLLDNLALLGYYDTDGMWFDASPVLRESSKFSSPQVPLS